MNFTPFLDKIKIPERKGFEKWCEENVSLSSTFSAKAGPFSLELTPYMKFPYKCLDYGSPVKEIDLMFGAQLGKTQLELNWMLYRQDILPGPMMFILPSIKNAQKFSKGRVAPLIDGTPVMRRKLEQDAGRAESQTMDIKKFPGGFINLVGSNSPSDLSSTPIRDLLADEIDRFTKDVAGEGHPIELGNKRTTSFHNSIKIRSSTPTIWGDSEIEAYFKRSTRWFFYVPCPHCNHMQTLEIANLTKDGYECEGCEKKIDDRKHKTWMLNNGEWRTNDPITTHYGFHLSQLYAPYVFVAWKDILKEHEAAKRDVEKMKVFVNTVLAQTYREISESAEWEDVKQRTTKEYRERVVWPDTIALTMAVDCQKDHLVFEIRGWLKNMVSYSLVHGTIVGAIGETVGRNALEDLVYKKFKAADGMEYEIEKTFIDSSYDTEDVYSFCRLFDKGVIYPIKGVDDQNMPISAPIKAQLRRSGKKINPRGLFLYKLGVSMLKKRVFRALNMTPKEYENPDTWRKIYFPKSYEDEWFKQLCSEQLIDVRNKVTNHSKKLWKKLRDRNEALDLAVYNLAAAHLLQLDDPDTWEKKKRLLAKLKKTLRRIKKNLRRKKKGLLILCGLNPTESVVKGALSLEFKISIMRKWKQSPRNKKDWPT